MTEIHPSSAAINAGLSVVNPVAKSALRPGMDEPKSVDSAVYDRVDLSGAGQKMINLARGRELASEVRSNATDESLISDLRKALADIRRITNLFSETIKSAFKFWR